MRMEGGGHDEEVASSKKKKKFKTSAKLDTSFMIKTAEKPYPLGLHMPIWPI